MRKQESPDSRQTTSAERLGLCESPALEGAEL